MAVAQVAGEQNGVMATWQLAACRLNASRSGSASPAEGFIGVDPAFTPARKAHPALAVQADALDDLAARLADDGVKVCWDDAIPGQRGFYVADPFGNRLELLTAGG